MERDTALAPEIADNATYLTASAGVVRCPIALPAIKCGPDDAEKLPQSLSVERHRGYLGDVPPAEFETSFYAVPNDHKLLVGTK